MSGSVATLGGDTDARTLEVHLVDYCIDESPRFLPERVSGAVPDILQSDPDVSRYIEKCTRKSERRSSLDYDKLKIFIREEWVGECGVDARIKAAVISALVEAFRLYK